MPILPMEQIETAYYLRVQAINRPGVLADITRILGDLGISIEAIRQKSPGQSEAVLPILIITQHTLELRMNSALEQLESLDSVTGRVVRVRLERF